MYILGGNKFAKVFLRNKQTRLRCGNYKIVRDRRMRQFQKRQCGKSVSLTREQLRDLLQEIPIILCEMRDIRSLVLRKPRYLGGYLSVKGYVRSGKPYLKFNKCRLISKKHPEKMHIKEFGMILVLSREQLKEIEREGSNFLDTMDSYEKRPWWTPKIIQKTTPLR